MKDITGYLQDLNKIAQDRSSDLFIVGGVLRDLYLGRKIKDIDIVLNKRVEEIARFFADKNEGSIFSLDEDREIYRVVISGFIFDFARLAGENIIEDLKGRDFTINALACPIGNLNYITEKDFEFISIEKKLIDPLNSLNDLSKGIIRITNKGVFKADPLRMWRALRLKAQLSYEFSPETIKQIKRDKHLAVNSAAERVKAELIQLFAAENISGFIKYIEEEFELFSILIPEISEMKKTGENQHHQENAWEHCLQVLSMLEDILKEEEYRKLVAEKEIPLIKLTALLHDIGKIASRTVKNDKVHYYGHEQKGAEILIPILKKLKFSRKEIGFITTLVRNHMRPMLLYIADNLTNKGRFRFFNKVSNLTPLVLLHSLADKLAAMKVNQREEEMEIYREFINDLLDLYEKYKSNTATLYLSGEEIIEYFSLEEGPLVGKALEKLREAQGSGKVKDKESAITYLNNYIKNMPGKS
ncbi:MAG: HD domain-containing protein [Halanaerobiaceae bacterium]